MKLSLFFLKLPFLERVLPGLEVGEEDVDPWECDFFGVVGGEANVVGVVGLAGRRGVLSFTGVAGGWWAGSSALMMPLVVPFGCLTSSEEDVPTEAFLGLLTGRE